MENVIPMFGLELQSIYIQSSVFEYITHHALTIHVPFIEAEGIMSSANVVTCLHLGLRLSDPTSETNSLIPFPNVEGEDLIGLLLKLSDGWLSWLLRSLSTQSARHVFSCLGE